MHLSDTHCYDDEDDNDGGDEDGDIDDDGGVDDGDDDGGEVDDNDGDNDIARPHQRWNLSIPSVPAAV